MNWAREGIKNLTRELDIEMTDSYKFVDLEDFTLNVDGTVTINNGKEKTTLPAPTQIMQEKERIEYSVKEGAEPEKVKDRYVNLVSLNQKYNMLPYSRPLPFEAICVDYSVGLIVDETGVWLPFRDRFRFGGGFRTFNRLGFDWLFSVGEMQKIPTVDSIVADIPIFEEPIEKICDQINEHVHVVVIHNPHNNEYKYYMRKIGEKEWNEVDEDKFAHLVQSSSFVDKEAAEVIRRMIALQRCQQVALYLHNWFKAWDKTTIDEDRQTEPDLTTPVAATKRDRGDDDDDADDEVEDSEKDKQTAPGAPKKLKRSETRRTLNFNDSDGVVETATVEEVLGDKVDVAAEA